MTNTQRKELSSFLVFTIKNAGIALERSEINNLNDSALEQLALQVDELSRCKSNMVEFIQELFLNTHNISKFTS